LLLVITIAGLGRKLTVRETGTGIGALVASTLLLGEIIQGCLRIALENLLYGGVVANRGCAGVVGEDVLIEVTHRPVTIQAVSMLKLCCHGLVARVAPRIAAELLRGGLLYCSPLIQEREFLSAEKKQRTGERC